MRFEKGEKKARQKVGLNSGQSHQKAGALPSTPQTNIEQASFCIVDYPITRWWAELV